VVSVNSILRKIGSLFRQKPEASVCLRIALRHLPAVRLMLATKPSIGPLLFCYGESLEPEPVDIPDYIENETELFRYARKVTGINPEIQYFTFITAVVRILERGPGRAEVSECVLIRTDSRDGTGALITAPFSRTQTLIKFCKEEISEYDWCRFETGTALFVKDARAS